jgi:hypothetical protein
VDPEPIQPFVMYALRPDAARAQLAIHDLAATLGLEVLTLEQQPRLISKKLIATVRGPSDGIDRFRSSVEGDGLSNWWKGVWMEW